MMLRYLLRLSYIVLVLITLTQDIVAKKDYTFMICISAANDLFPFEARHIKQMQTVGSNERINIVVNFDMYKPGQSKITKRFFIEKNKLIQLGPDLCMDGGDPDSLIDFCRQAIEQFPARHYVLVLSNHGTGALDPEIRQIINSSKLFSYNPTTRLIELDRTRKIGFLDYINLHNAKSKGMRAICFDDGTGNSLTNKKRKQALHTICTEYIKGPFAGIYEDACLEAMLEVAVSMQEYALFFGGSQEASLGTGYNYIKMLNPFLTESIDPRSFACHVVKAYFETYNNITQDYTQSVIDLSRISLLESNVDQIAKLLIVGFHKQQNKSVKEAVRLSRHKNFCTHFDEPSYIDLGHFYANLLSNIHKCELTTYQETVEFKQRLTNLLVQGNDIISKVVIANTVGKNLKHARGISIYFPERNPHKSYVNSDLAQRTAWLKMITAFIRS
jgi:Clostripain family